MKERLESATPTRPLTARQRREIATLVAKPDSRIDYTDIPKTPESFWQNAVRNPWCRPLKQQLTVRLDAGVVAWLRAGGAKYQTRMNGLLREAMLKQLAQRTAKR